MWRAKRGLLVRFVPSGNGPALLDLAVHQALANDNVVRSHRVIAPETGLDAVQHVAIEYAGPNATIMTESARKSVAFRCNIFVQEWSQEKRGKFVQVTDSENKIDGEKT